VNTPAQGAARESQEPFRISVDSISVLVWSIHPDGSLESVNRRWQEYTGLSEALQGSWTAVMHADDRITTEDFWRTILAGSRSPAIEARMRRFDGEYRWFLIRIDVERDASGNVVRGYCSGTDIEDRRQTEHTLRASENSLRLIVEGIPAFVFTRTASGKFDFANRRLLEYLGTSLQELQAWRTTNVGHPVIHPEDLTRLMEVVIRGTEAGELYETAGRLRRADGVYRWFRFNGAPWRGPDGKVSRWYGVLTDIDDLKRAEETLRTTQAHLSRATHLAGMSELSASIAHEINQPLAAVVANAHACVRWLSAVPSNVERAQLSAEKIIRDGNSAAEVVKRIRSLFRNATPIRAPLNMNEVIEEVCSLMAPELRARRVTLKRDLQSRLPHPIADRIQIQQVIANIIRNGTEAMDAITQRPKDLQICSRANGGEITVCVTDHGEGLRDPDAVFEPFYTTKPNGLGMGLSICRSIIEAHGGRLWAAPNEPHGARVGFALRINADESQ
jgi:PAS domain S-box-containing protein